MWLFDIHPKLRGPYAVPITVDIPWKNPREVCERCYEPIHRERVGPYTIRWEPGSNIVPDFPWCARNDVLLVSDRVKIAFEEAGLKGFVAWPLHIQEPKRVPKRPRIPRVASPYPGPPLWDLYVTDYVHLIPERCTLEYKGICPKCGRKGYSPGLWGAEQQWFVVDRSTWTGVDFMRPHELNTLFVTPRVIDIIKAHSFTDVEIFQRAEMADPGETPPSEWRMIDSSADQAYSCSASESADSYAELRAKIVSLPRLSDDTIKSCPQPMRAILKYLREESGDDTLKSGDLEFLRTARMDDYDYWLWRFEEQDGTEAYVTVSRTLDGSTCIGYNSNEEKLTPEQYIYGDYHEYF